MKHNTIIFGALATLAIGMFGCDSESQKLEGAMRARYLACEEHIWGEKGEFDFKTERCRCREVLCKYNETCNEFGRCTNFTPECEEESKECKLFNSNNGEQYWMQRKCEGRKWSVPEKCKTVCQGDLCKDEQTDDTPCEKDGCENNYRYACVEKVQVNKRLCPLGCDGDICKVSECDWEGSICDSDGNVAQCSGGKLIGDMNCHGLGCTDGECNKQSCDDGEKRCENNKLEECKDGSWGAVVALKSCDCVSSDERSCNPDTHKIRKCKNYYWRDTGEECCVDGETRCSDNAIETCQGNQWTQYTKCQDYYVCQESDNLKHACVCQPGCYEEDGIQVDCQNDKPKTKICKGECVNNECQDDNEPQPECRQEDEFRCMDNKIIQKCEDGEWQTTQTCFETCSMSDGTIRQPYCSCQYTGNILDSTCNDVTFCFNKHEYSLKDCLSKDNVDFCNSSETPLEIKDYCLEYMRELGCFEVSSYTGNKETNKWCFYDEKLHYCANGYDDTIKRCIQSSQPKCKNDKFCIGKNDNNSKECYKDHSCNSNYTDCGKCKNGTYEIGRNHKICIEGEKFECQLDTTADSKNNYYLCNNDNLKEILKKEGVLERYLDKSFNLPIGSAPMNFTRDESGNYYLVTIEYSQKLQDVSCE